MLGVGAALNPLLLHARADGGAVAPARGFRRGAVNLLDHGIVDISAERALDGFQIRLVAIARKLHPMRQPRGEIVHELDSRCAGAVRDEPRGHELGIGAYRGPSPHITGHIGGGLRGGNVLGLGIDEAPNLIDLDAPAGEVPKGCELVDRADLARVDQQLRDGVLAGIRQPRRGADAVPLHEAAEDHGAGPSVQLVHGFNMTVGLTFVKHIGQIKQLMQVDIDGDSSGLYIGSMKVRFEDGNTSLVETDQAHRLRLPVAVVQSARRKLRLLREAMDERDLYAMKSLHYEKLQGGLDGLRSIRLNDQWRLLVEIDQACEPLEVVIKEISNHYG